MNDQKKRLLEANDIHVDSIVGLPAYVTIWVALGAALVAILILIAYLYQSSRWSLTLRSAREDEVAAQAADASLYWSRLIAFTVSGFVAGLAGGMFAHFMGVVSISSFFLNHTFLMVVMLVIGGMQSLAGAVAGVALMSIVIEIFRRPEAGYTIGTWDFSIPPGSQELILAVIMLITLIFRKSGIMGRREITWPWRRTTSQPTAVAKRA
jgi:branched-chain amino acid transport system permease protein